MLVQKSGKIRDNGEKDVGKFKVQKFYVKMSNPEFSRMVEVQVFVTNLRVLIGWLQSEDNVCESL